MITCLFVHKQNRLPWYAEKLQGQLAPLFPDKPGRSKKHQILVKRIFLKKILHHHFALTSSFETSSFSTESNTNSCFSTYSVRSTCRKIIDQSWTADTHNITKKLWINTEIRKSSPGGKGYVKKSWGKKWGAQREQMDNYHF